MPPDKLHFPKTLAELDRLAEQERDRFLPSVRKLQLHQLMGLNLALEIAFKEIGPLVAAEDVRRGHRPPGTKIGGR